MKLFRTVQKLYQMMDIWPSQPNQQRSRFTTKNVLFFLFRLPILLSTLGYILFEKVTIIQRMHSFLVWITQSVCTINFVISFYKMPNIVKYIEKAEQIFQKSKFGWIIWKTLKHWNALYFLVGIEKTAFEMVVVYNELNEKIEKMSKFFYIALLKVTPAALLGPIWTLTSVNYFIKNLGEDSFKLPFPVMYVRRKNTPMMWQWAPICFSSAYTVYRTIGLRH